ncbi:hypothetical protein ASG36_01420 [Geodermatophilus sp. Leaf369]|jgi:hypothetical protein|uniref:hypothetical protein n=1 Tax=Geodermatophilus sp. Leaf369 TaxID=1736354 RepID=UPI0006F48DD0|nr:hypothetical protein [Geodermatophilus sp. Leaf369]KQS59737.1 hypothetical protein ASG36_01420 [Geodermatophilus sp. Leaf369]
MSSGAGSRHLSSRTVGRGARWAGSALTLLLAVVAVLSALPLQRADAASMWVAYEGRSVSLAPVPATRVELTAVSSSRLTAVSFAVGGTVVASTTTVLENAGTWRATATVDLTGRSGLTVVRTRFTNGPVSSTVDKTLRAVPPAPQPVAPPTTVAGPDTTGVPAGVTLTPQTGDLLITTSGTVVDGIDLTGCITVRAHDVVIRNSRITCGGSATTMVVATNGSFRNLVVEDSELDGLGIVDIGIGWQNYTLRRVEIRGTNDGARVGSNTTVDSSWIHAMVRKGALHPDAVQSTSGIGIRITNNTLDPRNYTTGDQGNASVMLGSELRPNVLQDVVVSGNRMSGGNYTVNVRGDATIAGVTLSGNTFTADAKYGPVLAPASVTVTADNVMDGTGAPAPVVRTA